MPPRDSLLSIHPSWWPAFFWIFVAQLIWEAVMLLLDAGSALSDMSPIDRIRFIRAELADDVAISAVVSMVIAETWRHIMITTQWLENLVERNKATYDEKIRAEGRTEGLAEVLALLDEDTRKDVERKLRRNGDSE
jgi:hypothetical protein